MSTLSLTKRPATIGGSINTRTERHGEDKVPGLDIPLAGILINGAELASLIDCPTAYDALYLADEALGVVPRFNAFGDLAVLHKFSNATVKLDKTTFSPAKLKSIRLAPQTGGLTEISFTLQVNPEE